TDDCFSSVMPSIQLLSKSIPLAIPRNVPAQPQASPFTELVSAAVPQLSIDSIPMTILEESTTPVAVSNIPIVVPVGDFEIAMPNVPEPHQVPPRSTNIHPMFTRSKSVAHLQQP
ncbi:hypothetical protein PIB30_080951, partial [Stylosanthes scabra]|nr:hypothetical protein [Stylosanthes scabra]